MIAKPAHNFRQSMDRVALEEIWWPEKGKRQGKIHKSDIGTAQGVVELVTSPWNPMDIAVVGGKSESESSVAKLINQVE